MAGHDRRRAQAPLAQLEAGNVKLPVGDGTRGLPNQAPFDAIIVTAAFPAVPPPLADQLAQGGRLVQPIGPGGHEDLRLFQRQTEDLMLKRSVTGASVVPLYGEHGYPLADAPAEA